MERSRRSTASERAPGAQRLGARESGQSLQVNGAGAVGKNVILRRLRRIGAPDVQSAHDGQPYRSFFGVEGSAAELAGRLSVAGNPASGSVRQPLRNGGFR